MYYPNFIMPGDRIGVTACSDGRAELLDQKRLDQGILNFKKLGYPIIETKDVRTSKKGRSAPASQRVEELYELLENNLVKAIIIATGGDYLLEILPLLDFGQIRKNPKWLQGFSDPTGLLYTVTVNCDMATVYGSNFGDFGMEFWHDSVKDSLSLLEGKLQIQNSYSNYMDGFLEKVTGIEGYDMCQKVSWKNSKSEKEISFSGRLLGGCLDVLINLVGTKYDKTKEFIEMYKKDKIFWYLESFALNSELLTLGLWQLREAGWFEHAAGFFFGRPTFFETNTETDYAEALHSVLEPLSVPIIYDGDFGHKPPRMAIVNGALGTITSKDGKGQFIMSFV